MFVYRILVYRIYDITELTEMVRPLSKAALKAVPSARIKELAKPTRYLGVHLWFNDATCYHLLTAISCLTCIYGVGKKTLLVWWS